MNQTEERTEESNLVICVKSKNVNILWSSNSISRTCPEEIMQSRAEFLQNIENHNLKNLRNKAIVK